MTEEGYTSVGPLEVKRAQEDQVRAHPRSHVQMSTQLWRKPPAFAAQWLCPLCHFVCRWLRAPLAGQNHRRFDLAL